MTANLIQSPLYQLACDGEGCEATFIAVSAWCRMLETQTRVGAREAGWQIRPLQGKGSRTAPDLCPDCRTRRGGESR